MTILNPSSHFRRKIGNHGGRVLEVRRPEQVGVAIALEEAVVGRADVAEVPGVQDHPHVRVGGGQLPEDLDRTVLGCVVDVELRVGVVGQPFEDLSDRLV